MNQPATLALLCLLPACATSSINPVASYAPIDLGPTVDVAPIELPIVTEPTPEAIVPATPVISGLRTPPPIPKLGKVGSGYTNFMLGYYNSKVNGAGEGEIFNLRFGRYFTSLISLEGELGFFQTNGIGDNRLRGLPVMANGRINLPLLMFEVYGGVGLGGIYYDSRIGGVKSDDWIWAGNAFIGAAFSILDKLQVGIEGKYYQTETAPQPLDEKLEGYGVFLYAGLRV